MAEEPTHLSATDARGGQKTNTVRYILAISLVAIILIFGILLFINR